MKKQSYHPKPDNHVPENWNTVPGNFPDQACIHHLYEEQTERTPQKLALVHGDQKITYRELNNRANLLAHRLRELGIRKESLVAINLHRSQELFVALFAILKAGGAYLPLDPNQPQNRLMSILIDSQSQLLITKADWRTRFKNFKGTILEGESVVQKMDDGGNEKLRNDITSRNLAYVIYTSGSTGKPKGVMIEHRSVVNYLIWCKQAYSSTKGNGAPLHASVSFDMSVTSLFLPLISGSTVHITSDFDGPDALKNILGSTNDFSFIKLTPAHLNLLRQQVKSNQRKNLCRTFVIGGENLLGHDIEFWKQYLPNTKLFNEYGPTEATVGCCVYEIDTNLTFEGSVPIGRPIANTELYILDKYRKPVGVGTIGELFIGGICLARGYLNRPDLTKSKFIPHPFKKQSDLLVYQTGDLARWLPDGNIEFLGRIDNQIKLRGYRIELAEIESTLLQHPHIKETTLLLSDQNLLIAYVVCETNWSPSIFELRSFLLQRLPEYMIPSSFVFLEKLPLTGNGKIDRNKLRELQEFETGVEFVPPRNELETKIEGLWTKILPAKRIGIHDNFFVIGGHSILAVKLIEQILIAFEIELSFIEIQMAPTIAQLANVISKKLREPRLEQMEMKKNKPKFILSLREGNPDKTCPIYCLHPLLGATAYYFNIGRHLNSDQPFYGIQSPAFNSVCDPFDKMEEMAAYYLKAIRKLQPKGSFILMGHSSGANIAFEMAIQLQEQGQSIPFLAFVDAEAPIGEPSALTKAFKNAGPKLYESSDTLFLCAWCVSLAHNIPLPFSNEDLEVLPKERRYQKVTDFFKEAGFIPKNAQSDLVEVILKMVYNHTVADMEYFEKNTPHGPRIRYKGKTVLFRCTEETRFEGFDIVSQPDTSEFSNWDTFCDGSIDVFGVPNSNHVTIITEPTVKVIAEKLLTYLDNL